MKERLKDASEEQVSEVLAGLSLEERAKIQKALEVKLGAGEKGELGAKGAAILLNKFGKSSAAYVAMTAEEVNPAWLSALTGKEVKSMDTKLCTEGQVGITVLMTNICYAEGSSEGMPTSLACKMHGPGEEQRKGAGAMGLYAKEILIYHKHMEEFSLKKTPPVQAILYQAEEDYLTMVHFNFVMDDLNVLWEPYKMAELTGTPTQEEWDQIFERVVKFHIQYWDTPFIKKTPFAADESGVFKLSPLEQMMAGTAVELEPKWWAALEKYGKPIVPDILDLAKPFFDVYKKWQGENGTKILAIVQKKLAEAPQTLCHGDINPGNIWKGKKGSSVEGEYCFADWQVTRMAPAAWDFCTPQAGMEPSQGVKLAVVLQNYHAKLSELAPEIAKNYPYEKFLLDCKYGAICFWMFIMGYCYTSIIVAAEAGQMDKTKLEFTFGNFMKNVFNRCSTCFIELDMAGVTEDLLKEVNAA